MFCKFHSYYFRIIPGCMRKIIQISSSLHSLPRCHYLAQNGISTLWYYLVVRYKVSLVYIYMCSVSWFAVQLRPTRMTSNSLTAWILYFYTIAKYQRDGKYFRTARLPERIIPEIMTSGTAYTIKKFTDTTGAHCTTCHQRTDCRPDGQCNRCYMIDNPAVFERQYGAPRKRRYIFDNGPSSKFYRY